MSDSNSNFDCAVCGRTNIDFKFYGVSHCNHILCGVCAIKLTKFSKETDNVYDYSKCVICKQDMTKVIISATTLPFESYDLDKMIALPELGLLLDGPKAHDFYRSTVIIKCSLCQVRFDNIDELMDHVDIHKRRYCSLCVKFNKCLPSEFLLMTDNDYHYHNNKEHPKCSFCNVRYYDSAHLIQHVKKAHFLCDICHRRHGFVAYKSQSEMLGHYREDHYMCEVCQQVGVINVFDSEYNLRTHKVLEHDNRGLVSEGLVAVGYGDNRGPRRRPQREGPDEPQGEVEAQTVPEVACVQQFPPLGAAPEEGRRPLGMMAVSNDANDARGAFTQTQSPRPVAQVDTPSPVYQGGRRAPKEDDFPALGGGARQGPVAGGRPGPGPWRPASGGKAVPSGPARGRLGPGDFPELGTASRGDKVSSWKDKGSPELGTASRGNKVTKEPQVTVAKDNKVVKGYKVTKETPKAYRVVKDRLPSPPPASHWTVRDTILPVAKETITSNGNHHDHNHHHQESWTVAKDPVKEERPSKPRLASQEDFPSLGGSRAPAPSGPAPSWTQASSHTVPMVTTTAPRPAPPVPDDPLDFPALPFRPADPRPKTGRAPQPERRRQREVPEATPAITHWSPPEPKEAPSRHVQSGSMSSRGLDCVPYVPATNEAIVMVDHGHFKDLKAARLGQVSQTKERAPAANGDDDDGTSHNRYSVLTGDGDNGGDRRGPVPSSARTKVASLASKADFPSLPARAANETSGGPKTANETPRGPKTANQTKKGPKAANEASRATRKTASLAEAAASVTGSVYTPPGDMTARSEALLARLREELGEEGAGAFLGLAGRYRGRQASAGEYLAGLASLETGLSSSGVSLGRLVAPMVALLPDIGLQRALLARMPPAWARDVLVDCPRCGQVLTPEDAPAHASLAHPCGPQ